MVNEIRDKCVFSLFVLFVCLLVRCRFDMIYVGLLSTYHVAFYRFITVALGLSMTVSKEVVTSVFLFVKNKKVIRII